MSNTEIIKLLGEIDAIAYGFVNGSGDGVTYDEYQYVAELISEVKELVKQREEWVPIESAEDLPHLDQEYLLWDGCQHHLDYGEMCMDTGTFYFANGTKATHYKTTDEPDDEF